MGAANIVWAIDPFASRRVSLAKSRHMLAAIRKTNSITVEPISIVSPKEARWPLEFETRWSDTFVEIAEDALGDIGRRIRMPEVVKAKIVVEPSVRREAAIASLLQFAEQEKAKMILVNLHSHHGLRKFRLGGFTESLIGASSIPVLAIRPNTRVPSQVKVIAFPTDLGPLAKKYLTLAISIAKEFSAKLVIIHRLEVPPVLAMDWVGFAAAAEMESMREAILENEVVKQGKGQAFLSEALSQGVEAEFLLEKGMAPLSQSIVNAAMRINADLIAVAAQDHGLTQKILGSTSREVLQLSPRPVLILPGHV